MIGLIGLLYGAQGVTQTAQQAMATVWNIRRPSAPASCPARPTAADRQVLADPVHAEQRRDDQAIGVGFGDYATTASRNRSPPGIPTSHSDTARSDLPVHIRDWGLLHQPARTLPQVHIDGSKLSPDDP